MLINAFKFLLLALCFVWEFLQISLNFSLLDGVSWFHHGSPAFSLVCVLCPCLYHSSCVSLLSLYCVCACGRGFFSTGSARWIHSAIKSPIKPLVSLLLVARSFRQSTWLFESWLPLVFLPCALCLACKTNLLVFLHLALDCCARCTDSRFVSSLLASGPACYQLPCALHLHRHCPARTSRHDAHIHALTGDFAYHARTLGLRTPLHLHLFLHLRWTLKNYCYTVNQSRVVHLGPNPTQTVTGRVCILNVGISPSCFCSWYLFTE